MSLAKLPKLRLILPLQPILLLQPRTLAGLEQPQELRAFPLPLAQGHLVSTLEVPLVLDTSHQALVHQGSIPVHLLLLVGFLLLQESQGHTPLGREPLDNFQEDPELQDSFQEAPEHQDSFQEDPERQDSFREDQERQDSFQEDPELQDSFQEDPELQDSFREDREALASIPLHQDRTHLEEVPPNPSHLGSLDSFLLVPTLPRGSTLTCRTLEDSLPQAPTDQELPVPIPLRRTPAAFQGSPAEATPRSPLVAGAHRVPAPSRVSPAIQAPTGWIPWDRTPTRPTVDTSLPEDRWWVPGEPGQFFTLSSNVNGTPNVSKVEPF